MERGPLLPQQKLDVGGGHTRKDRLGLLGLKLDEDFLSFMVIQAFAPGDKFMRGRRETGIFSFVRSYWPLIKGQMISLP